jgi:hypothetical protein
MRARSARWGTWCARGAATGWRGWAGATCAAPQDFSFGRGLIAGGDLFREKSTGCWWLICSERKVLLAGG